MLVHKALFLVSDVFFFLFDILDLLVQRLFLLDQSFFCSLGFFSLFSCVSLCFGSYPPGFFLSVLLCLSLDSLGSVFSIQHQISGLLLCRTDRLFAYVFSVDISDQNTDDQCHQY